MGGPRLQRYVTHPAWGHVTNQKRYISAAWYPKRLDAITDALIYQSKFGDICCDSFIPANYTVTTIITF